MEDRAPARRVPVDEPIVAAREPFDVFFRREYRRVLGLAFVLCGNWSVAEELTMEAFEAAFRHWSRVSGLESPGGWVRRVLANSSVSWFRRLAAESRARVRLAGDRQTTESDEGDVAVWEAVRRLPRRQAQVVSLFYVEGYSRTEVGVVLGISEESVKTHLERARQRLAKELQ